MKSSEVNRKLLPRKGESEHRKQQMKSLRLGLRQPADLNNNKCNIRMKQEDVRPALCCRKGSLVKGATSKDILPETVRGNMQRTKTSSSIVSETIEDLAIDDAKSVPSLWEWSI